MASVVEECVSLWTLTRVSSQAYHFIKAIEAYGNNAKFQNSSQKNELVMFEKCCFKTLRLEGEVGKIA